MRQEIEKNGNLVFMAAQRRGGLVADPQKYFEKHPAGFAYLLDEDRSVTKAYGVYKRLGIDSVNIARPATFVIGRDGNIKFVYVGRDQLDRAPLDQVMEAFRAAS